MCVCVCVYVCVCMYVCVCVCMYVCMYVSGILHDKIEFESIWPVHKIPIQVCVAPL